MDWGGLEQTYPQVSSSGEVLPVLVEGHGHNSVRGVEGLLYTVAVVNVDVDVQHPLVVSAHDWVVSPTPYDF